MYVLAIANQKGGVAKTTTAAALGHDLAAAGRKVLLIDIDPQASLSHMLGIDDPGASIADVIGGATRGTMAIQQIIKPISPGLDLAPADINLSACELGLTQRLGREAVLKQALQSLQGYDLAIIDCPPSLGLLTLNGLIAARGVIVPTLPAAADLRGVKLFLDTLESIRDLNPALELLGVLIVQYDPRLIAHNQALGTIQGAGLQVIGIIPRSVRAQEAAAARQPITQFDPAGKVSEAYKLFTKGIIKWLKEKPPA